jgi:membrane protein
MLKRIIARGWTILVATWTGWRDDGGNLLSAATAYYASFSLFPLCLVLIAALGFVGRYSTFAQTQQRALLDRVSLNVSPWLADELQRVLTGVQARATLGGPLGVLALILVAIGIFLNLENIFDRIWSVPVSAESDSPSRGLLATWLVAIRTALWDRLLAFLTLLSIGMLLVAVSLTSVIWVAIRPMLAQLPAGQSTWHVVQWLSTVGCDAVLLATIYRVLPRPHVRWVHALCGGLLAAVVWAIGRAVLLSLVVGQQYSAYGVVGALMGVMLWFYYASAVVFLGAEFVHAMGLGEAGDASK